MLEIKDLYVSVEDQTILRGVNLTIDAGEIHAIMGPNGSGKSTLSNVLAGHEDYTIDSGDISYFGKDLTEMEPHERAAAGVFLAFQYPVEIPGVTTMNFLKTAVEAQREYRGQEKLTTPQFMALVRTAADKLGVSTEMLRRAVNVGFSGGEKKRAEVLQMAVLEPKLCILDETDSGLDIDALRVVASGVEEMRSPERSALIITHYQRLLDYIAPDHVHVMSGGRIVRSGGKELALELEKDGYAAYEVAQA